MTSPLKRLAAVPLAVVLAGIDVPELAASDMIGEVLRVGKPFLEKELTCLKVESDKLKSQNATLHGYSVAIFHACQDERNQLENLGLIPSMKEVFVRLSDIQRERLVEEYRDTLRRRI